MRWTYEPKHYEDGTVTFYHVYLDGDCCKAVFTDEDAAELYCFIMNDLEKAHIEQNERRLFDE